MTITIRAGFTSSFYVKHVAAVAKTCKTYNRLKTQRCSGYKKNEDDNQGGTTSHQKAYYKFFATIPS